MVSNDATWPDLNSVFSDSEGVSHFETLKIKLFGKNPRVLPGIQRTRDEPDRIGVNFQDITACSQLRSA